jgi:membrane protease YdiL (CAAX protease family)
MFDEIVALKVDRRLVLGLAAVVAAMVVLFEVPRGYFVAATFVATSCMIVAALGLGSRWRNVRPKPRALVLGLASAGALYLVFYAGGAFVDSFHPFGITSSSENAVYSLIAAPSNPLFLQVLVLLFDSAGFESFFRGSLQTKLQGRFGVAAAPLVAALDAAIHVTTFNPIWIGGTFLTDVVWGITFYYGKSLQGSFVSHFVWDLAIFIVRPVT